MKIYLDGQYVEEADAKISVFDHGLLYGDGVFEGIRIYNGRVFRLREHLDRLYDSAKAILLKIPLPFDELLASVLETCRQNQLRDGYIRLLITRGVGTLGLSPDRCPKASVIIIADKVSLYPEECYKNGLKVKTSSTRRMNPAALSPAIKSLNYLNNIMAKVEASQVGAEEAILLNDQGYVAECSGDNIFVVKKNRIFTPPVYAGALGGITRLAAIELLLAEGYTVTETNLTLYDLYVADECFLTGTAAEVVPVVDVDSRIIGNGHPGPITGRLIHEYRTLTQSTGEAIY